ncbi:MAG: hypothetical protein OEM82_01990 [Acidobacteriota bacterium]|nr:hypothetical protein [Acidobacteriota bacterium]MDH3529179.1 hypothetical protein [Acidobacteriota bacterium]
MNKALKAKIRHLDELILKNHRNNGDLLISLTRAQEANGLLDNGRPFAPVLRPFFFGRAKYTEISRAAETLSSALERMTLAALENDEIMDELDLSEAENRMARVDPGYPGVCHSSRLDTFLHGVDFKFLEFNAENPAGIIDQMQIEKVLELIPEVNSFLRENPHWKPRPHLKLLNSMVEAYRDFGGVKEFPSIAIVDWADGTTVTEFEVLKVYFESRGHNTIIADPEELVYEGGILRAGDFEIDIFYKRVIIHEFLERFEHDNPLSNAYRDGNVFMANSFRVKVAQKKASFAVIADPKFSNLFTGEQREVIKRHVPWTRRVRETKTDFHGKEIRLIELVRKRRENFILKPNDDYGGSGIFFGWESSESDWDEAIETALKGSYVVQERAPIEKTPFLTYDREIVSEDLIIDFDPFLFRGRVEGGLVRMSSKSLVNVAQGGYETALIVLEDPC